MAMDEKTFYSIETVPTQIDYPHERGWTNYKGILDHLRNRQIENRHPRCQYHIDILPSFKPSNSHSHLTNTRKTGYLQPVNYR